MLAYQFYLRDSIKGFECVGVLPERRRNPVRITEESIMNWGRKNFGRNAKAEDIFFTKVDLEESGKLNFEAIHQVNQRIRKYVLDSD